jgi:hypothetical protein
MPISSAAPSSPFPSLISLDFAARPSELIARARLCRHRVSSTQTKGGDPAARFWYSSVSLFLAYKLIHSSCLISHRIDAHSHHPKLLPPVCLQPSDSPMTGCNRPRHHRHLDCLIAPNPVMHSPWSRNRRNDDDVHPRATPHRRHAKTLAGVRYTLSSFPGTVGS